MGTTWLHRSLAKPDVKVPLLRRLCVGPQKPSSAYCTTLPNILKEPSFLKPFIDFMKSQGSLPLLMFCMDVDTFMLDFEGLHIDNADKATQARARSQVSGSFFLFLPLPSPLPGFLLVWKDEGWRSREKRDMFCACLVVCLARASQQTYHLLCACMSDAGNQDLQHLPGPHLWIFASCQSFDSRSSRRPPQVRSVLTGKRWVP